MRRILVVANETVEGEELRRVVVERASREETEVMVVCPALVGRIRHWLSDVDRAREQATDRLIASLAALTADGVRASGQIGDSDPVQAIEDALRTFPADELVISTHPPGRSNWLEKSVVQASEVFGLPITHVVVDLSRRQAAV
jgi:hypothetical protein